MKSNLPNQRTFDSIDSSAGRVFRAALFVIYTIFFTLNLTAAAQAVVPVNGSPPVLTPVTINDGPGDQNDLHISGDWVVYTSGSDLFPYGGSIRYYNFSTNIDAVIPTDVVGGVDYISDISGNKRIAATGQSMKRMVIFQEGWAAFY